MKQVKKLFETAESVEGESRGRLVDHTTGWIMVRTSEISIDTAGHCDVHDITSRITAVIEESGVEEGQVLAFVPGSTAGITTIEFEPGLILDIQEFFESLLPEGRDYHHHATWGDDNGSSHVRAALLGPSLTVPFADGVLTLGTWQQIMLLEFDTQARRREVVVQVVGE